MIFDFMWCIFCEKKFKTDNYYIHSSMWKKSKQQKINTNEPTNKLTSRGLFYIVYFIWQHGNSHTGAEHAHKRKNGVRLKPVHAAATFRDRWTGGWAVGQSDGRLFCNEHFRLSYYLPRCIYHGCSRRFYRVFIPTFNLPAFNPNNNK